MRNVLGYLVVFAFFLSSVVELEAATIRVPADQLTIQAGINAASRGTWSSTAGSCNCEQREVHSLRAGPTRSRQPHRMLQEIPRPQG